MEESTLSQEHRDQTSTLKKYSWIPGIVYTLLGIVTMLVGWGSIYGGDMARIEAKIDMLNRDKLVANSRMAANEVADSLRSYANQLDHKKFSTLFFFIGRRFNFSDKYFETLQQ